MITSMPKKFSLLGIGNALIDSIENVDEQFLIDEGMKKGDMTLIDDATMKDLSTKMVEPTKQAGGSAANTMACFASFGGNGAFIGRVGDDKNGNEFAKSLEEINIYPSLSQNYDVATGQCMIFVTPDHERTMNTYLGAACDLTPNCIDTEIITQSNIIFLEGYLFNNDNAKQAFKQAALIAKNAGNKVALTLSANFCVDIHREDFQSLVENDIDILFANEEEITNLCETESLGGALNIIADKCPLSVITKGKDGVTIFNQGIRTDVPITENVEVVDTTGAGDAFAGGFLYGLSQGYNMEQCGHLGNIAAGHIIADYGPRPRVPLNTLNPYVL